MDIETYLNLNLTYFDYYVEYNKEINEEKVLPKEMYICVGRDVDIIFSTLNILPSKSGYLFWKDAVFLYLISKKEKISICNDIYPVIAQKHNTTTMCIDRAMRRCFENVLYYCSKKQDNYICDYLKSVLLYPHSSEILAKLVELISSKKFQENKLALEI